MTALAEQDKERHARAVLAVCEWGRQNDVYVTVDDAVNIVTRVMDAWKPIDAGEAEFDLTRARYNMRLRGSVIGWQPGEAPSQ
jgi:hypothetical protein